jgi:tetratricopeptide (TPR) repeat protein
MKRGFILAASLIAIVCAGIVFVALGRSPDWTTSSPAALVEFEAAMAAKDKLYTDDAIRHLKEAVRLDPEFTIAKLELASHIRFEESEAADVLFREVFESDLDNLTDRERFMIERVQFIAEHKYEEADQLVDTYLEDHPDDFVVLQLKANLTFRLGQLDEAEKLYTRLLETNPNYVLAYNQLGYITMQRMRFTEAEEYFTSYRFIAPDQANPHDSLGELYILQGRYDEAEETLRQAVSIRPDFWASYEHLILSALLRPDFELARTQTELARSAGGPEPMLQAFECWTDLYEKRELALWQEILDAENLNCRSGSAKDSEIASRHLAACKLKSFDQARELEQMFRKSMSGESASEIDLKLIEEKLPPLAQHLTGVRLAFEGDFEAALEHLKQTDEKLRYINSGEGTFKLSNLLCMVEVMRATDRLAEASEVLIEVRTVNPSFVKRFEEHNFKAYGFE